MLVQIAAGGVGGVVGLAGRAPAGTARDSGVVAGDTAHCEYVLACKRCRTPLRPTSVQKLPFTSWHGGSVLSKCDVLRSDAVKAWVL